MRAGPTIKRSLALALALDLAIAGTIVSVAAATAVRYLPPLPVAVAKRLSAASATPGLDILAPKPHAGALARRVRAAILVGRATWGPACEDELAVRWTDYDDTAGAAAVGERVLARAHDCTIELSQRVLDDAESRTWAYAWPWFCTLMVHEYGHLAGQAHSTDHNNVMYPVIDRVFWRCSD